MKQTIIRLLLIAVFYLLFRFVVQTPESLLIAFVISYILEPVIMQKA